jgi:hypothetical protein
VWGGHVAGGLYVALLALSGTGQSASQAPPPPPVPGAPAIVAAPEAVRPRRLSVTITPFYPAWELFDLVGDDFPVFELAAEIRVHEKVGIALMVAGAAHSGSFTGVTTRDLAFEAGAEPRWYAFGDFRHGMQLGVELRYFRMSSVLTFVPDGGQLPFHFEGYLAGPFLGYKYTADVGFTVEAKLGFVARDLTMSDAGDHPNVLPITDLKIGWSF